jgi:thiol:disulfide interchange protein
MLELGVLFFFVSLLMLFVGIIWLLVALYSKNTRSRNNALLFLLVAGLLQLASWSLCTQLYRYNRAATQAANTNGQ